MHGEHSIPKKGIAVSSLLTTIQYSTLLQPLNLFLARSFPSVKWIGHANLLWELHKQELAKFGDSKRAGEKQHARSLARLKKELEEERERVYAAVSEERDASMAQLRAAQGVGFGLD